MDTSFNCPKCKLHITADECVVGEEIDCPECGEKFRVPPMAKPKPVPVVVRSATPVAAPVAAHATPVHAAPAHPAQSHAAPTAGAPPPKPAAHAEHKPLSVPQRSGPQEPLVKKVIHAEDHHNEEKKIRLKTIKRGSCVEVGHDLFDEKVTEFLNKVGRENIIHMSSVAYGAMDSTGHMLPDYGIMIVYNG